MLDPEVVGRSCQWPCSESSLLPGWFQGFGVFVNGNLDIVTPCVTSVPPCPAWSCSMHGQRVGGPLGLPWDLRWFLPHPDRCHWGAPRCCCVGIQAPVCMASVCPAPAGL